MIFKTLIIGAGNIGASYDKPGDGQVLTHAHAYAAHKNFAIGGFVDTDSRKLNKAVKNWGGQGYQSIEDAFKDQDYDIVSVAVPDELHYQVLRKIIGYKLKLIFAEKPFVLSLKEYDALVAMPGFNKVSICLNYRRRFVKEAQDLKDKISHKSFGRFITGVGCYGKGFIHNGTHLLDLINFLLGDFKSSSVVNKMLDYTKKDPSYSVILKYPHDASVYINAVDSRLCTVFELDLIFEKKRIKITDIGNQIEEYDLAASTVYPGYRFFKLSKTYQTGLPKAMYLAVDNIYQHLTTKQALRCTHQDALLLLNQLRRILNKNGEKI